VRIPFLFVVAVFFGHLVARARGAEREAREACRREATITDFVAEVVRDFKLPLGAIRALAEVALEPPSGPLSHEHRELLRRIDANARHMTKMASNLLDAPRFEVADLELRCEPANLLDVTLGALHVARSVSEFKGVAVELDVVSIPPDVVMDVGYLDRAIWNLLDNAIRNSPAGGEVIVSLDHREGEAMVGVSDEGRGLPSEDLPALFEHLRLRNGADSRTSSIGLLIAKRIVDAHGGRLDVDSEPNGGATFTLRVPVSGPPGLARDARRAHHVVITGG
jgi:signal transduction histidine kinase